jgi:hypothetical protein
MDRRIDAFRWESQMMDLTLATSDRWWGARQGPDFAGTEIVGPDAIADLAAVRFDRSRLRLRQDAKIHAVPDALALRVLAFARRRALTSAQLAEACRVSASGVRRAISFAIERGALVREGRTHYRTHMAWGVATERTVAVELKLHDWSAALQQTYAYSLWANAAWAIIGRMPPRDAAAAAAAEGLGLAVLFPSGEMQLLVRPRSRRTARDRLVSLWTSEQVLARAQSARFALHDDARPSTAPRATLGGALAASLSSA